MEALAIRILTAVAVKLLSEKLFAGLIVRGLRWVAEKRESEDLKGIANDVAEALDREDLIKKAE